MAKTGGHSATDHSQGKEDLNAMSFLPLDIIFHILIFLPADFLYNSGRYVCKAWASMISDPSFIKEHLSKSKGGLLIQEYTTQSRGYFLSMEGEDFSVRHLSRFYPGKPMNSCRGLCLFFLTYGQRHFFGKEGKRKDNSRALYIVNPVTMQFEMLPSVGNGWAQFCHLAYILQTGQYKVACIMKNFGILNGLVITVGIDVAWRRLNLPRGMILEEMFPPPTSAIVGQIAYLSHSSIDILAINLYDETTCFIRLPNETSYPLYWLLKLGENLSCLVSEESGINVYVLRDSKKCEWTKVCQIAVVIARNEIPLSYFFTCRLARQWPHHCLGEQVVVF